jgi:hypothetical protein
MTNNNQNDRDGDMEDLKDYLKVFCRYVAGPMVMYALGVGMGSLESPKIRVGDYNRDGIEDICVTHGAYWDKESIFIGQEEGDPIPLESIRQTEKDSLEANFNEIEKAVEGGE